MKYVNRVISPGGQRPLLKVDLMTRMVVEGVLTFAIVMVSLIVRARGPKSFFLRTWIMSIIKLSLSIVDAGPAMNPATISTYVIALNAERLIFRKDRLGFIMNL